ncbi:hypothetical protein EVAR_57345_1 [Eumeta japonica]|uniref:Uncharacterized protein n=1 Tax=Eumeta variegata TaxID=151549 RepID=A0A4C1Z2H3_EUMVA|nr:hypothetical protein EVAR_57345_1 [Eumeta japonica]
MTFNSHNYAVSKSPRAELGLPLTEVANNVAIARPYCNYVSEKEFQSHPRDNSKAETNIIGRRAPGARAPPTPLIGNSRSVLSWPNIGLAERLCDKVNTLPPPAVPTRVTAPTHTAIHKILVRTPVHEMAPEHPKSDGNTHKNYALLFSISGLQGASAAHPPRLRVGIYQESS